MGVEFFLRISDVRGDSSERPGWIDIESFHFGQGFPEQPPLPGVREFTFTMVRNRASPTLFLFLANGKRLREAVVHGRRTRRAQRPVLEAVMEGVLVAECVTGGMIGAVPTDRIRLSFEQVRVLYWSPVRVADEG